MKQSRSNNKKGINIPEQHVPPRPDPPPDQFNNHEQHLPPPEPEPELELNPRRIREEGLRVLRLASPELQIQRKRSSEQEDHGSNEYSPKRRKD